MNITENERRFLKKIANSEYNDGNPMGATWLNTIVENHADAGTLASVEEKDLVRVYGRHGDYKEVIIQLSESGAQTLGIKPNKA